jgi:hypothetical protein
MTLWPPPQTKNVVSFGLILVLLRSLTEFLRIEIKWTQVGNIPWNAAGKPIFGSGNGGQNESSLHLAVRFGNQNALNSGLSPVDLATICVHRSRLVTSGQWTCSFSTTSSPDLWTRLPVHYIMHCQSSCTHLLSDTMNHWMQCSPTPFNRLPSSNILAEYDSQMDFPKFEILTLNKHCGVNPPGVEVRS